MKKLLISLIVLVGLGTQTNIAQTIDVQVTPVDFFFGTPDVKAEYLINDRHSVALTVGIPYGKLNGLHFVRPMFVDNKEQYNVSGIDITASMLYFPTDVYYCKGGYVGLYYSNKQRKFTYTGNDVSELPNSLSTNSAGFVFGTKNFFSEKFFLDVGLRVGFYFGTKIDPKNFIDENYGEEPIMEDAYDPMVGFTPLMGADMNLMIGIGYRF